MERELYEIMGALECGVLPRSGNIDKMLQTLLLLLLFCNENEYQQ